MKKFTIKKNLPLIITGVAALGLVGAAAYVHFSRPANQPAADTVPSVHPGAGAAGTTNSTVNTGAGTAGPTSTSPTPTPPPAPSTTSDPKYNSPSLAAPVQTFNKSHTPISLKQTDTNQPDYPSLVSTCQSVPGATCEILVVMGNSAITVAGPTVITDANGAANFSPTSWNANDKGLSVGTWTIKAVAKKDGQTSTSTSNYTLTVNP